MSSQTLAELIAQSQQLLSLEQNYRTERRDVEAEIARLLGNRGYVRWGDTIIRTAPASSKTVCDDPVGFSEWAEQADAATIRRMFNPAYIRKTGLPDGVFDTFFHTESSDERSLVFLPPDKAPKVHAGAGRGDGRPRGGGPHGGRGDIVNRVTIVETVRSRRPSPAPRVSGWHVPAHVRTA